MKTQKVTIQEAREISQKGQLVRGRFQAEYYVWWRPNGAEYCLVWDSSLGPLLRTGIFAIQRTPEGKVRELEAA